MYVRVNGHLKVFQDIKQLVAFSVRYEHDKLSICSCSDCILYWCNI